MAHTAWTEVSLSKILQHKLSPVLQYHWKNVCEWFSQWAGDILGERIKNIQFFKLP